MRYLTGSILQTEIVITSYSIHYTKLYDELATDFLGSTFAGSVKFYETILPSSGALATYLPAADSSVYAEPQVFFNDQAIYSLITEFAGKVPSNNTGVYYYEARDAVATALTNVVNGADIASDVITSYSIHYTKLYEL